MITVTVKKPHIRVSNGLTLLTPPKECPRCKGTEIVQGDDQVNYPPHVICNNNDCNFVMFEKDLIPKDSISRGLDALARGLARGFELLRKDREDGRI